jgi:hypothetical protein
VQIKRQSRATCQAFVDWAGELGQQASEDLDDESRDVLKIRIEKFQSDWDVFTNKIEDFSQNNVEVTIIKFFPVRVLCHSDYRVQFRTHRAILYK